ncbi:MAG: CBS domain-containing protein, partial [Isosphaeraceae bacterium]|nr:CBS domain-containing protein [Isosphaeraceae bacterium]
TALEAVLVMRDANCGVLPVTEDGRPVGVVTDRDIALALADHTADLAITPVGQLMATDLVTIETDATLEQAIGRMGEQGLRRLLVVDAQGQLRGILSLIDLAGQISERAAGRVLARIAEYRA